ncbi:uncharacterized protein LOC125469239 [Pyrus x bretschneideri]|uniref:uncharacterized protein LOC125469239 n=1 Tax=Pyrus x bretschneideri TaxID=225117 RepID=UPI00202DE81B|nr:uncharacterized protein LOC125469239 [Pyrus x bretschneideri]
MAGSSTDLCVQVLIRVNYEFWCIRMKIIFKSHNLWSFVEDGFTLSKEGNETDEKQILANQDFISRDAKALGLIQGAVSDEIFPRIANQETANDAWMFLTRLSGLVNKMKMFGETLPNKRLVEKMLISLTPTYDNIVFVIEGTKKLDEIDPNEVVATLEGFEQRLKRHTEDEEVSDKAFSSLSIQNKSGSHTIGTRGRNLSN